MISNSTPAPTPGRMALLGGFTALVVAGALSGAFAAADLVAADGADDAHGPAHAHRAGPFAVGDDVPTSFGYVAVEHAETTAGLTAKQLGGAVHGIGSFVGRDKTLVQASVTLTNTEAKTLRYSPSQFRLVARRKGSVRRMSLSHASVKPGVLQPDAAVDARLSFIAPRDGSRFAIEFADPGHRAPMTIDLGRRAGRATAADRAAVQGHASHDHDH